MSTLADPAVREACCQRFARVDPQAKPKWGRMTAPQMVCHLNDAFLACMGQKQARSIANPFSKTVMRWVALRTPMPWPKGIKTMPELEQGRGGTPPVDWDLDRAELRRLIGAFADLESYAAHPIFGNMSKRDWLVWGYRHVDHHMRQFGV